jgi:hypothetical protein
VKVIKVKGTAILFASDENQIHLLTEKQMQYMFIGILL